jgi:hypothetical protein
MMVALRPWRTKGAWVDGPLAGLEALLFLISGREDCHIGLSMHRASTTSLCYENLLSALP